MQSWQDIFDYRDGNLYWPVPGPGRPKNRPAGSLRQDVYRAVELSSKKVRAHRIIWELRHGQIPTNMLIDHIDVNPQNNKIENLRLVDAQLNGTRSFSNSETGWKGVVRRGTKFQAILHLGSTNLGLVVFDDASDAAQMFVLFSASKPLKHSFK